MTYKEFGEEADIAITVRIEVNGELVLNATADNLDEAISWLNTAERHDYIGKTLTEQYESLPEFNNED